MNGKGAVAKPYKAGNSPYLFCFHYTLKKTMEASGVAQKTIFLRPPVQFLQQDVWNAQAAVADA